MFLLYVQDEQNIVLEISSDEENKNPEGEAIKQVDAFAAVAPVADVAVADGELKSIFNI